MLTNLITVATVTNSAEAQFVANRLKDAGIESAIADDNVVTMDFLFGNAVGWIKVQVREQDADKAEELLATIEPVNEDEIPWDEAPEDAEEDDKATPEELARKIEERKAPVATDPAAIETEQLVQRAYRQAIIGLFLFPPLMNLFSLYLLNKVETEESKRLSDVFLRRSSLAFLINVLNILAFGWLWLAAIIFFFGSLLGGW